MKRPVATMGRAATALIALAAAVLAAQLGQFKVSESSVFQPAPVVTWPQVLLKVTGALGNPAAGFSDNHHDPAPRAASTAAAPAAAAHYHEPLVTYTLSTTALHLRPASPQQQPATHVARLPLAGAAPLTSATFMPSDLAVLSSRGYETYMTRTVDFFKNQAAAHRLLEEWEAAGWKDPWSGTVTQPDTLLMCGRTVARRRGYARAVLAAEAAAAHRPSVNISATAATMGVASLRTRCPQSLLLTRAGIGAATVADVLDVVLLPGDGAPGNETVELLLRVVDNPHIVPEHDPDHPIQVLEGDGNHYHFLLPGDATIDAARLLKEVEALPSISTTPQAYGAGAWGLVLKGGAAPCSGEIVPVNTEITTERVAGFTLSIALACSGGGCDATLSGTGASGCELATRTQCTTSAVFNTWTCTYTLACQWSSPGPRAVSISPTRSPLSTSTVNFCVVPPSPPPPPPSPPPPSPPPPSPPPPSPPPPNPPPSPPPPSPPPAAQCPHGYSSQGLPPGSYSSHCTDCCFNRRKLKLICGTCRCFSAGKRCKRHYQLPRRCTYVTYAPGSNKFACRR